MKHISTKTADQLDLQALHRMREQLVSQRSGIPGIPPSALTCRVSQVPSLRTSHDGAWHQAIISSATVAGDRHRRCVLQGATSLPAWNSSNFVDAASRLEGLIFPSYLTPKQAFRNLLYEVVMNTLSYQPRIPKSRPISPELNYVSGNFSLEDAELSAVRKQLLEQDLEYMSVAPAEGRILQFLIRGFRIRTVIEIGALYGYSSLCMAKALPADGKIISLEKDPSRRAIAVANARASTVAERIDVRCGDAQELLAHIDGPVDMVFIDADKASYVRYLDWAEENVRPGGLIVGDNTFLFGALWGEMRGGHGIAPETIPIMQEFNRRLSDPRRYNSILMATAEGMTIAQKL